MALKKSVGRIIVACATKSMVQEFGQLGADLKPVILLPGLKYGSVAYGAENFHDTSVETDLVEFHKDLANLAKVVQEEQAEVVMINTLSFAWLEISRFLINETSAKMIITVVPGPESDGHDHNHRFKFLCWVRGGLSVTCVTYSYPKDKILSHLAEFARGRATSLRQ